MNKNDSSAGNSGGQAATDHAQLAGLIACAAHEAKNLLSATLEHLDQLRDQYDEDRQLCRHVDEIHQELGRVNASLVRMLTLYKIGESCYSLDLEQQPVRELIEETLLGYHPTLRARGLMLEIDCPHELLAWCDFNLISGVVADALHNACRYARTRVRVAAMQLHPATAEQGHGGVCIAIEDDGPGLDPASGCDDERGFISGNTGLGMRFASLVAGLHRRGALTGQVELNNESRYGGARWSITLP